MLENHDSPQSILAWLEEAFQEPVRDPLWGNILLSKEFLDVYGTPAFQKLGRIKQLGPAYLTYPGAVHTRLNHSLGVYHIAYLMAKSLVRHSIAEGPEFLTKKGITTFLAAAMLHDLGHFPYAHSLKELPLDDHEKLGADIIRQDAVLSGVLRRAHIPPEDVSAIIDHSFPTDSEEILFYRALLSGTLDPDKLDYLNRDAFFCGVPYGNQDTSYIIDKIHVVNGMPAIPERAAGSIEHLLFSKYQMYRNVYWHKRNRAATAMIKEAIISALAARVLPPEALYGMDDEDFSRLPSLYSHEAFALIELVKNNQLFSSCYDSPFLPTNSVHKECLTIAGRATIKKLLLTKLEQELPNLKAWQLIIDIPEPLSLEVDIPLLREDGSTVAFSDTTGIFDRSAADSPARILRRLRIFVPEPAVSTCSRIIEALLQE